MMGTVAFVSHALGDREDDPQRWHDNLANAIEWIRFLIETTQWCLAVPWFVYAAAQANGLAAGRRIVDSMTMLERVDVCLLIGGVISPHMRDYDAKVARRYGVPVVDLTSFGVTPPDKTDEDQVQLIRSRVRSAIKGKPRRVWMPLLTDEDLQSLRNLRHVIYTHVPAEPGEFDKEIALLDRIIQAASERGAG